MKELTYEDCQKISTPRMMWVWDSTENNKKQRKVIYFLKPELSFPIVALSSDETSTENFKHCAEIEIPKSRRFTYRELAIWLQEKPTREYKHITSDYICHNYDYLESNQDKEVHEDIRIREDDGEWHIPTKENERKEI